MPHDFTGSLHDDVPSIISDWLPRATEQHGLDFDKLRDDVSDQAHEAADRACIYFSECEKIIDEYETHHYADPDSYGADEGEFSASQWRDAMQRYAYFIAVSVLERLLHDALDEIEEAAEELVDTINELRGDEEGQPGHDEPIEVANLKASIDCPYGWAAHSRELSDGTHIWEHGQLDGLNGAAVVSTGVWLYVAWERGSDG